MKLRTDTRAAVDLLTTPVHLGLGSRAMPVEGFAWEPEVLESYSAAVAADGAEGRMVMIFDGDGPWTSWERHPAGDEVVHDRRKHLRLQRLPGHVVGLGDGDEIAAQEDARDARQ